MQETAAAIDYKYIVLDRSKNYHKYQVEGEPEILHIVKGATENTYFVFWEDGYELQPYKDGMEAMTKEEILSRYNIKM